MEKKFDAIESESAGKANSAPTIQKESSLGGVEGGSVGYATADDVSASLVFVLIIFILGLLSLSQ
jgi:hypothetical protein